MLPAAARACTTHGVPVCKKHVDKKIYKFSLACRQIEAHQIVLVQAVCARRLPPGAAVRGWGGEADDGIGRENTAARLTAMLKLRICDGLHQAAVSMRLKAVLLQAAGGFLAVLRCVQRCCSIRRHILQISVLCCSFHSSVTCPPYFKPVSS
jgi:hypothetical protein